MIPSVSRDNERAVTRVTNIAKAVNTPGQRWYIVRVMGTSTMSREYQVSGSKDSLILFEKRARGETEYCI